MGVERGAIRNRDRYKQCYDHSAWGVFLPNKITPSDIDVVFDYRLCARQLHCEFSVEAMLWSQKPFGQRCLYEQLLRTSNYNNACALCNHDVPTGVDINSLADVDSFHVMRCVKGEICYFPSADKAFGGELWGDFVRAFYGMENKWGDWWN